MSLIILDKDEETPCRLLVKGISMQTGTKKMAEKLKKFRVRENEREEGRKMTPH